MILDGARRALARTLFLALRQKTAPLDADALARSAVVFAPHPDDEVLGCGGTILAKRRAGARVTLVFMTDGSQSHTSFVEPAEMRRLRHAEALEAARIMGIGPEEVLFLDFPDHALSEAEAAATARTVTILHEHRPAQVFAPCSFDWHVDHRATYRIASRALETVTFHPVIYEYSAYLWKAWPFSREAGEPTGLTREAFRASLRFNWRVARHMTHHLDVEELDRKRSALAAHRTQIERPEDCPAWRVLGDWGGGDFLRWQWHGTEFFCRR